MNERELEVLEAAKGVDVYLDESKPPRPYVYGEKSVKAYGRLLWAIKRMNSNGDEEAVLGKNPEASGA